MRRIDTGYYESIFRGVIYRVTKSDIAPVKFQWSFQVGSWKQVPGTRTKKTAIEDAKKFINQETYKGK